MVMASPVIASQTADLLFRIFVEDTEKLFDPDYFSADIWDRIRAEYHAMLYVNREYALIIKKFLEREHVSPETLREIIESLGGHAGAGTGSGERKTMGTKGKGISGKTLQRVKRLINLPPVGGGIIYRTPQRIKEKPLFNRIVTRTVELVSRIMSPGRNVNFQRWLKRIVAWFKILPVPRGTKKRRLTVLFDVSGSMTEFLPLIPALEISLNVDEVYYFWNQLYRQVRVGYDIIPAKTLPERLSGRRILFFGDGWMANHELDMGLPVFKRVIQNSAGCVWVSPLDPDEIDPVTDDPYRYCPTIRRMARLLPLYMVGGEKIERIV